MLLFSFNAAVKWPSMQTWKKATHWNTWKYLVLTTQTAEDLPMLKIYMRLKCIRSGPEKHKKLKIREHLAYVRGGEKIFHLFPKIVWLLEICVIYGGSQKASIKFQSTAFISCCNGAVEMNCESVGKRTQ